MWRARSRRPSRCSGATRRREPQFADYASELRSISVDVVASFIHPETGDPVLDRWTSEALFGWLVESTLTWLDHGDPALDSAFVARATAGLSALRSALS